MAGLIPVGGDAQACGGDDECFEVLRDVWLFLDNEMDPEARAAVQRHVDECSPCLEELGVEEKLKKLLHRTCSNERAPQELRLRVASAITRSAGGVVHLSESVQVESVQVETVQVESVQVRSRDDDAVRRAGGSDLR